MSSQPLLCFDYKNVYPYLTDKKIDIKPYIIPSILSNWDHSPRSGKKGVILVNSNPANFKKHLINVFDIVKEKDIEKQYIFLKSWNEWGEGNYMEPDSIYGDQYIKTLRSVLDDYKK